MIEHTKDGKALINDRHVATILAALRLLQRLTDDRGRGSLGHFEDCTPLDDDEIDELCETIDTRDCVI